MSVKFVPASNFNPLILYSCIYSGTTIKERSIGLSFFAAAFHYGNSLQSFQRHLTFNVLHLGTEGDGVFGRDGGNNLPLQAQDVFRGGCS